jgi:hypothetical protein
MEATEMPAEATKRNQSMLVDRLRGRTFAQQGDQYGVSPQAAHVIVERVGRRHVEAIVTQMWLAQKAGQLLVLAVAPELAEEQTAAVRYLEWLLTQLPDYSVEPKVHYRPAGLDGGFVFALEDLDLTRRLEGSE